MQAFFHYLYLANHFNTPQCIVLPNIYSLLYHCYNSQIKYTIWLLISLNPLILIAIYINLASKIFLAKSICKCSQKSKRTL